MTKKKRVDQYNRVIRVQVTKRIPKRATQSIIRQFIQQGLTFALSQHESDYEIWREILPGDRPRVKNRKDGMIPCGIITEDDLDLDQRNFVCIWDQGKLVYKRVD